MILVDGHMRSGNTFLVALLRTAFPRTDVQWGITHQHRLDTLVGHPGTLVCPVREPVGCLTSLLSLRSLYNDLTPEYVAAACDEYVAWMDAIRESDAIIAEFSRFSTDPRSTLAEVGYRIGVDPVAIRPSILRDNLETAATSAEAMTDPHSGCVPRTHPDSHKAARAALLSHPSLALAQVSYASVVD